MKVGLINPPLPESAYQDMDIKDIKSTSPPLGLLSIASNLRKYGVTVSIHDGDPIDLDCDVYGITAMTINFNNAVRVAKSLKAIGKTVILGGCHASAMYEDIKKKYSCFDEVIQGEGETKFCRYLGIPVPDVSDLDQLPFPSFDLVDMGRYNLSPFGTKSKKSFGLVSSRGCYGKCTFCSSCVFGKKIKKHSASYIISLMRYLRDSYQVTDFLFYDDLFVADKSRLIDFCKLSKEEGFTWSCCSRVDSIDKNLLHEMKRSGCHLIEFGIESGSQRILDLMQKGINKAQIWDALEWTKEAGITSKGNFILGYLGDDDKTTEETIQFACELPLDYAQHTFYTPLPGSEDWMRAPKFGKVSSSLDDCSTFGINFVPSGMSKDDLLHHSRTFYRKFYLRPSRIFSYLLENPRRLVHGFNAFRKIAFH